MSGEVSFDENYSEENSLSPEQDTEIANGGMAVVESGAGGDANDAETAADVIEEPFAAKEEPVAGEPVIAAAEVAGVYEDTTVTAEAPAGVDEETVIAAAEPAREEEELTAYTSETADVAEEPTVYTSEPAYPAGEPAVYSSAPADVAEEQATSISETAVAAEEQTVNISETADVAEEPASYAPESGEPVEESADDDAVLSDSSSSESFEEMLEKSIKTLHTGQKVSGVVTSITATEVSVDLGTKQSGYIPISEFTDDANANIEDIIKVGDAIESFVLRVNDLEGMVMLSKKRLDAIRNWDEIEAAKDSRAMVEGLVTEENKGGIVVNVKGVRVFVPASQTGLPKSSPMTELVRKTVRLRITEVNQSRRRVVGSIRAVQAEERREKADRLWEEIETGKKYDGVVKSMTSYGVFVDIGGVDGMIHISELSWTRIKQPSEVMSVGDEVSVYVLSFDKGNRKISLGYKKSEDNPWSKFISQYSVGDIVTVKIVKMMPFGAFAEICPGVDGLIHISQITDHRIGLPSEILSDGQQVNVKITEIDMDRKKVSLSIRALLDPSSQPVSDREAAEAAVVDTTPVIVYDTDSPPPVDDDEIADDIAEPEDDVIEPEDNVVVQADDVIEPEDDVAEPEDDVIEPEDNIVEPVGDTNELPVDTSEMAVDDESEEADDESQGGEESGDPTEID